MAIVRPEVNHELQTIILPESLKVIGNRAFEYCESLREICIPSSTVYLGARAFKGCSNLVKVELSEGLHYIGEEAFGGCSSLRRIRIRALPALLPRKVSRRREAAGALSFGISEGGGSP